MQGNAHVYICLLVQVCIRLGLPPVLTAAVDLWNWRAREEGRGGRRLDEGRGGRRLDEIWIQDVEVLSSMTGAVLPYSTLPYSTLPYPTLPYATLLYPTLPYPTLPYPTLLYPTVGAVAIYQ